MEKGFKLKLGGHEGIPVDLDALREESRRDAEEYNSQLESQAKPYSELIVPVTGIVRNVVGRNSLIRGSNGVYGPGYSDWETGQIISLEFDFESEIVKHLTFRGYAPIRSGDSIEAYILAAKEESLKETGMEPFVGGSRSIGSYLLPRDLTEKETAIYLDILTGNGKDRFLSLDYTK